MPETGDYVLLRNNYVRRIELMGVFFGDEEANLYFADIGGVAYRWGPWFTSPIKCAYYDGPTKYDIMAYVKKQHAPPSWENGNYHQGGSNVKFDALSTEEQ
jgi:hypothetical protein